METMSLKFEPELAELVLNGEKTCTWRLLNEKIFQIGQTIELIKRPEMVVFASAIITSLANKTMGELNEDDKLGHEKFKSDEELFNTYSRYYKEQIDESTQVTVIHFELL